MILGFVAIVHIYFKSFQFFHSRQEKAYKDKIVPAHTLRGVRLRVVLDTFGSSENLIFDAAQCQSARSSTPRIVSLGRVRLHAVLANFGFSKNILHFSKYHHMDPKFPVNGNFGKSKIQFNSAECQPGQSPTLHSVSQFLDLRTF